MSQDEVTVICKAKNEAGDEAEKLELERARLICYWSVVAMNGNKVFKKPSDLFKLPWEKGFKKVTSKEAKAEINDECKH